MKVNGQVVTNAWAKPIIAKTLTTATFDMAVNDLSQISGNDVTVTVRIPSNHETTARMYKHTDKTLHGTFLCLPPFSLVVFHLTGHVLPY